MKYQFLTISILTILLLACKPSLNITSSYVNKEAIPKTPFHSIFVMAINSDKKIQVMTENRIAKLLEARGKKVVKSSDLLTADHSANSEAPRVQNIGAIKKSGCDAVLTIALMDVKKEEVYNPGNSYTPVGRYDYYGTFFGYYNYREPQLFTPGYYSGSKTYFVETNFYAAATDKLLWSIQSSTYDPGSFENWFQDYSGTIISQLKKEGLIKK